MLDSIVYLFNRTGVRGRRILAPAASTVAALDHDLNSRGGITPSVILETEIPDDPTTSFCQGQVHVIVNDSVFEASTPFRHAASIRDIVATNPISLIYSDGGPDHRLTYESVKMSLTALFIATDLDMLVACRCCPGQSWMNPVERIMSLLNLGLQNVSLERDACSEEIEGKVFHNVYSLRKHLLNMTLRKISICLVGNSDNLWINHLSIVSCSIFQALLLKHFYL